jgi:NAD(P)-dependent dehydrogenase (short-subunit alcohol dehydrogenase family)
MGEYLMSRQTVIVTGASRGLGAAIAEAAAQMGAAVVLCARSEGALNATAERIQAAGGEALAVAADVSQSADCRRIVGRAVERFGRVDALVNNAGVLAPIARIGEVDPGDWNRSWSINVTGPLLMVQAALPQLREHTGRIINVSSGAAVRVKAAWGAYCATKAALNMFSEALAIEEPDLTTLAVRPGKVDTAMQTLIREKGEGRMAQAEHERFVKVYEDGALNPPGLPGRAIAALALHAPHDWSGEFIAWDDPKVQKLAAARKG